MEIFNEQKLRAEIAKNWGEYGAHIEVYDRLLKKANSVLPQADVSCLLPTLQEVRAAIKEIGKKSTAPDKETPNWMEKDIENGINWALNYVVKKSQGNSN